MADGTVIGNPSYGLEEEGPNTDDDVISLCANEHRAAHFSKEKIVEKKLGSRAEKS